MKRDHAILLGMVAIVIVAVAIAAASNMFQPTGAEPIHPPRWWECEVWNLVHLSDCGAMLYKEGLNEGTHHCGDGSVATTYLGCPECGCCFGHA